MNYLYSQMEYMLAVLVWGRWLKLGNLHFLDLGYLDLVTKWLEKHNFVAENLYRW